MIYAMAHHNIDTLAEAVKELNFENKKLKKKFQEDQEAKFSHDKKMLVMQLQCKNFVHECKKDKMQGFNTHLSLDMEEEEVDTVGKEDKEEEKMDNNQTTW
jgi:hypothetical protein